MNCSGNKLTKLPKKLPNSLIKLDCSLNQLEEFPEDFDNLTNLEVLICDRNKFEKLPENLQNFKNLKVLHCQENKLTKIPFFPTKLEELYIDDDHELIYELIKSVELCTKLRVRQF